MTNADPVSVVVVERSVLVRDLLRHGLAEEGIRVVAESGDSTRSVALCEEHRAHVLIISSQVCSDDVLRTFPAILATGTRIIGLCAQGDTRLVAPILLAGSTGYLFQVDASVADVVHAIKTVAAGQVMLHPAAASAVLHQWRAMRDGGDDGSEVASSGASTKVRSLTARERDILVAMGSGLTTRAIGTRLGMAAKTVETHKSHIFAKLGARNQAHAVAIAVDRGLLGAPGHDPGQF